MRRFLWALLPAAAAIFQEEAGVIDWRKEFIGRANHIEVDAKGKLAVVATDLGVVAGVNPRTGSLAWRKVLSDPHIVNAVLFDGNAAVTVAAEGNRVFKWSPRGELLWEAVLNPSPVFPPESSQLSRGSQRTGSMGWSSGIDAVLTASGDPSVVILENDSLTRLLLDTGEVAWHAPLPAIGDDESLSTIYRTVVEVGGTIYAVGINGNTVTVSAMKTFDGATVDNRRVVSVGSNAAISQCQIVNGGRQLVCLGAAALYAIDILAEGSSEARSIDLDSSFKYTFASRHSAPASRDSSSVTVIVEETGATKTFRLGASGFAETVDKLPPHMSVCTTVAFEDRDIVVGAGINNGTFEVAAVDGAAGGSIADVADPVNFEVTVGNGRVERCAAHFFRRTSDRSIGYSLIVVMDDDTMMYIRDGNVRWSREEALASISSAIFVDLPAKTEDFEGYELSGSVPTVFVRRILRQVATFSSYFGVGSASSDDSMSDKIAYRDQFNKQKMVVAAAASGRLVGIHTKGGVIAWTKSSTGARPSAVQLFNIRDSVTSKPLAVAVLSRPDGDTIVEIDPLSGSVITTRNLDFHAQLVRRLEACDETGAHILLLLADDGTAHLYPDTAGAKAAFAAQPQSVFAHTINRVAGVMKGYRIANGSTSGVVAWPTWTIRFDPDVEKVAAVAFKHANERASSLGEILGDRSVIHKFLNPHIIAVATTTPYVRGSTKLTVYLIDVVKGHVFRKVSHPGVYGAVHLVQAENWVAYHYRSRQSKRYEITMTELFDGTSRKPTDPFSSMEAITPSVVSQTYVTPFAMTALAVTKTKHGITEKQLLAALPSGAIIGLNKRLIDARRPINDKAAKHAEGLMPYNPKLILPPQSQLNYNQTVHGVRQFFIGTSGLESTSLVLAAGLDLYLTETAPSKKFDTLNDDFPQFMVVISLIALSVGILYARNLSHEKKLSLLWK